MGKHVLLIGWHPSVVDYSKHPGLDAATLEAALRADEQALNDAGYKASLGFIHDDDSAADTVASMLRGTRFDVVLIGAGVRKNNDKFLVFETLVNVVHANAPQANIAFNTGPRDTADAVRRWT